MVKILIISFIVVTLGISATLSLTSVTGYVVADTLDATKNTKALIFFLAGLFATCIYLRKYRF